MAAKKRAMHDVIIVGGGLAALAAAHACSQHSLSTLMIGRTMGGSLLQTPLVESLPGLSPVYGPELAAKLKGQIPDVHFKSADVTEVRSGFTLFNVTDHENEKHRAKAIIIATGRSPHMLEVPGENEYLGKGVTTQPISDYELLKDGAVAVYGSSERATLIALWLANSCPKVHLLCAQSQLQVTPYTKERLSQMLRVDVHLNARISRLVGSLNLESVQLERSLLKVDGLVLAERGSPNFSYLKVPVKISDGIITNEHCGAAAGVFACGSCTDGPELLPVHTVSQAWRAAHGAYRHAKGKK